MAIPIPLFTKYSLVKITLAAVPPGTAISYECQVTTAALVPAGGDLVSQTTQCPDGSFSETTPVTWSLALTGVQDVETEGDANLLWLCYDHVGETADLEFYPNTDAAKAPVGSGFKATVKIGAPSTIGGGDIGAYATFDTTFGCQGKPERVDAAGLPVAA